MVVFSGNTHRGLPSPQVNFEPGEREGGGMRLNPQRNVLVSSSRALVKLDVSTYTWDGIYGKTYKGKRAEIVVTNLEDIERDYYFEYAQYRDNSFSHLVSRRHIRSPKIRPGESWSFTIASTPDASAFNINGMQLEVFQIIDKNNKIVEQVKENIELPDHYLGGGLSTMATSIFILILFAIVVLGILPSLLSHP